ncbi:MAG: hypothetical protein U0271_40555 [Polyangiaceae bacterium]
MLNVVGVVATLSIAACGPALPPVRRIPGPELPLDQRGIAGLTLGMAPSQLPSSLDCKPPETNPDAGTYRCSIKTPTREIPLELDFAEAHLIEERLRFGDTPSTTEQCQTLHDILAHAENAKLLDRDARWRGHTLVDQTCGKVEAVRMDVKTQGAMAFAIELGAPHTITLIIRPGQR